MYKINQVKELKKQKNKKFIFYKYKKIVKIYGSKKIVIFRFEVLGSSG